MKAMVLAAGLGTRLRPLTDDRPKALVTVAGRTLLELTLSRLRAFGVREVILNVHHFADMIVDYLQANRNFGMRIEVSREELLLDTGGGLKKAAWFFLEAGESAHEPFIVHNVDVLSTVDLARMVRSTPNTTHSPPWPFSRASPRATFSSTSMASFAAAASVVMQNPNSSVRPSRSKHSRSLAFTSFRLASSPTCPREGVFSIIPAYLRLAAQGEVILAFRSDKSYWRDLGRPENLAEAERDLANGKYPAS